jgi:hypothetical protein
VLLTAVAEGLRHRADMQLARLPRMADFALWATACETALWPVGTFQTAYVGNLGGGACDMFEADPVASAVIALMDEQETWRGTATMLLRELTARTRAERIRDYPKNSRALAGRLRQLAAALRSRLGLDVDFLRQPTTRMRIIRLARTQPPTRLLLGEVRRQSAPPPRDADGQPDRNA